MTTDSDSSRFRSVSLIPPRPSHSRQLIRVGNWVHVALAVALLSFFIFHFSFCKRRRTWSWSWLDPFLSLLHKTRYPWKNCRDIFFFAKNRGETWNQKTSYFAMETKPIVALLSFFLTCEQHFLSAEMRWLASRFKSKAWNNSTFFDFAGYLCRTKTWTPCYAGTANLSQKDTFYRTYLVMHLLSW